MNLQPFFLRLRRAIVRRTFSGEYRTRFYDALRFMLDNNISLRDALDKMRNAWTDFGQKWHPFAELTDDLTDALRENAGDNTLDATLGRWLPADEAAVLSAGIHGGDLPGTLQFATELTGARKRIMAAVAQMSVYPLGLVIMLSGTLFVVNTKLIPVLSRMSAPDSWGGHARIHLAPVSLSGHMGYCLRRRHPVSGGHDCSVRPAPDAPGGAQEGS